MKIVKILKISFHSYRESRTNYHGKIFADYIRFEIEAEGNAQMAVKIQIQLAPFGHLQSLIELTSGSPMTNPVNGLSGI